MKALHDIEFIMERLPQQYPLLMVDRILEYEPGKHIRALKNVTINEEFFVGHFPARKIMPGVLLCEALAQVCALFGILEAESNAREAGDDERLKKDFSKKIGLLSSVKMKFLRTVVPGDHLVLEARPARSFHGLQAFDVRATVDGAPVVEGQLQTTIRT